MLGNILCVCLCACECALKHAFLAVYVCVCTCVVMCASCIHNQFELVCVLYHLGLPPLLPLPFRFCSRHWLKQESKYIMEK